MDIVSSYSHVAMALFDTISRKQRGFHSKPSPASFCQGCFAQERRADAPLFVWSFSPRGSRNGGATFAHPQGYAHLVPFFGGCAFQEKSK